MAKRPSNLLYRVRRLLLPEQSPEGDRALLDRYAETRDGDAFRELLDRHGALVLGACRRVLGDADLAEDVFQATFLVLARNPRSVRGGGAIGPWLYTIARRLARRALSERIAERRRQQKAPARPTHVTVDFASQELMAVLNAELEKLPDRLRIPLEICYLQGRTQEEAARQLGQSLSTVRRRLEKALSILRLRLKRRGTTLEAALLAAVIAQPAVARVPPDLVHSVLSAACAHSTVNDPQSTTGHLVQEGLRMLTRDRSKQLAALVLGLGVFAGVGLGLQLTLPSASPPKPATTVRAPGAATSNDETRQRLAALWQKQSETMNHCRFEILRVGMGVDETQEMRRDEFDKLVGGLNVNEAPGFLQKVLDRFPVRQGEIRWPLEPIEVRVDGRRRFERSAPRDPRQQGDRRVLFSDDTAYINYWSVNQQASICDPGLPVLHTNDFRYLPFAEGKTLDEGWTVQGTTNGRVKLKYRDVYQTRELEADAETGFIYHHLSIHPAESRNENVNLQFGPIADQSGRVMPAVRIDARFLNDKLTYLIVHHILKANLDATFTDADFAIGVPAGTRIYDHRGLAEGDHNPKYGCAQEAVPDVRAFADALSDKTRSIWPRLKYGTPAPAISPAVWLTQKGKVDPPNLKGKILLIDFWGTFCGPCIAELPRVQEVAKKYADSDLVLIGLHTAGTPAEEVAEFARKKGLTYLLGIDRSGDDPNSFGATFKAFGVRGVPKAAVIDREGRLVHVASFDYALLKAEELLNGKPDE